MKCTSLSYFIILLLGVILSMLNESICMPFVNLMKSQISGRAIEFDGYEVNEYVGIPYAQPPVGPLRFQKTQKLRQVPRNLKAINVPPACHQYSESPYPWYINGSYKSEDCLYLNIWTPVDACLDNQKAVLFWVHGGGFRFGSIQDRLYDGVALAAIGDIIVVTVNYRVGAFGFLTTDTDEAPGNAGLWDVLEALKWVNKNIEFFGGDTSRITIAGESAGAVTVGYLSISPLSAGLFSNMIMESGSPQTYPEDTKTPNLDFTKQLASKVGCTTDAHFHRQSVTECLKKVKAEDLGKAEMEILRGITIDFSPQYGDELLPKSPRKAVSNGEFRCNKLLIGNNNDEGSFILTTILSEIFGFFGEKSAWRQTVSAELLKKLGKNWHPHTSLLHDLLENAYNISRHKLYTLLGDLAYLCPDVYYAEKCAETGGDVYFYFFTHRPSITPWSPWMGVAHFEEVQFVFGKPLLQPELYQDSETKLSREMIEIWSNFVKTGKPNGHWPLYNKQNPVFKYLGIDSAEKYGIGPHKQNCDLLRPVTAL